MKLKHYQQSIIQGMGKLYEKLSKTKKLLAGKKFKEVSYES